MHLVVYERRKIIDKTLESIILDNSGLIYSIISKYTLYYDKDDLYQVAVMGIIKAYKNYNNNASSKFTTYAYKYILGEVLAFVNTNKGLKLSKEYLQLIKKVNIAKATLTQKLMKVPSNYELSLFLELDEKVIEQLELLSMQIDSLDRAICEDGKKITLLDTIDSATYNDKTEYICLEQEIEKLPEDEQRLLKYRYYLDQTQQEVADNLGINQVQVSRNEKKILKKLKNALN